MAKLDMETLDPRNNLEPYTRQALNNADIWTPQQIRAEYSRLRSIARKRLERLAVNEPESYAYRHNKDLYKPVKELTPAQMKERLYQVARFVAAKTGSVQGIRAQRKAAVATLREHGYTGITQSNIKAFGQFMDEWRQTHLNKTVGSPTVAELFEFTQDHDIPWERIKDNFAQWLRNKKKLEQYVQAQMKKRHGKSPSADEIIERFDKLEAQRRKRNASRQRARREKQRGEE